MIYGLLRLPLRAKIPREAVSNIQDLIRRAWEIESLEKETELTKHSRPAGHTGSSHPMTRIDAVAIFVAAVVILASNANFGVFRLLHHPFLDHKLKSQDPNHHTKPPRTFIVTVAGN
ncbi:hypothetical protein WH47_11900 [Habropoda laboriosa]|uniref:Uncharacterized protein n=1 Tax=Habropoda laboriosa TaxID=597456 RepID=A0A0L7QLE8_9HYME|nr:hypothetical protein WH47_11900 [Habropoda laboriosa]